MSGLRSSNSLINTVVDTLRFRGVTEPGLLTTSSSGLVSVGTAPTLTNLTVTGASILGISAVVMGPLTANSVNALVSLTTPDGSITNLDASNATIDTLTSSLIEAETVNISNASITNGYISFLDASNSTITVLDVSAATIRSLDASNATITVLDVSAATIRSLDASNATITILDASAASIRSLDASNATVDTLTATNGSISALDVSTATITTLDVSAALIRFLDVSAATVRQLDASSATINSLDVSNGVITYLDVSAATFNHLDASSVSVPGGVVIADRARIGQDISENFVFITAFRTDTIARIRGSNRSDGTLQLGANAVNSSNIVLNADGSCSISKPLFVPQSSPSTLTLTGIAGGPTGDIPNPPNLVRGLWSITFDMGIPEKPRYNLSTTAIYDGSTWIAGGAARFSDSNTEIIIAPKNDYSMLTVYMIIFPPPTFSDVTIDVWFSCINQFT